MFSVIFPGQGSQVVGMGKEFYEKFELVKKLFKEADSALDVPLSKIILEGPKDELDLTVNTQPAIFLISYSIFQIIRKEFDIDLSKAKFYAGHSLGEYSAIACAGYLDFQETIKILQVRGNAMQNSVPNGEGGMLAVLGTTVKNIENILEENKDNFYAEIANDNSEGQIVLSGKNKDLVKMGLFLKENKIKNIKLPVSAPFHCSMMKNATNIMREELGRLKFKKGSNPLISNITANEIFNADELKDLLIKQIENRVRWRESVINMINKGVKQFIEIGPGKVLSGLIKRINKEVNVCSINNEEEIKNIKI
ncbi:ACP S-malonyltransferase [Candidatus Pelagibacter communis]|uniref:ACP S-malonyltransferase n=1 Tax=Pelagibacter ubique TaxID=198252 RepID=UPI00094CA8DD|nr:ACP S-malonyltransferase [Candidatus Pelagibacter ubique]|tara:strand:+ start:439 stop:1365 length:927 start_codon:yes stop_codon:yes gene_type:complete